MVKRSALGRGLGALITDAAEDPKQRPEAVAAIQELRLEDIFFLLYDIVNDSES